MIGRFLSLCGMLCALWALPAMPAAGPFGAFAQAQEAASGADWQPDPEEQWLFDLRTDRFSLGQGVRGYAQGPQRSCLDLGDMVRALDLPVRINSQLGRAEGWMLDERRTLLIDREQGRVEIASSSSPLAAGDIVDTPEGWCVRTERLAEWLGVRLRVDLSNSIIRLEADAPLPFELAAERRARAARIRPGVQDALANLPRTVRPYQLWQTPSVDVIASAEARRDASGANDTIVRYEAFGSGELLGASFASRLASDEQGAPRSLRLSLYRADPAAQLLGPLRATEIAMGDVTSVQTPLTLESGVGRGVYFTNRPFDQPAAFDRTSFRGDLPVGWEAELYRNGQLLALTRANSSGRYEFLDVELLYGMNQFEITLYGPQGQVRRSFQNIPVGLDSIPPNQWRYWLGVIENGADLLRFGESFGDRSRFGWRGLFALERGLDTRTSMGVYASSHEWLGQRFSGVELALRRSIGSTLAEFGGAWQTGGGAAGRLLWTGALGRGSFQAESLWLRGGYASDRVSERTTGLHALTLNTPVRIRRLVLPTQLDVRYRSFVDGSARLEGQARVSATFRRISLTSRLAWGQSMVPDRRDPSPDVTLSTLASLRLGAVRVRAESRVGLAGNARTNFAVAADGRISDHSDWRLDLGYDAHSRVGRTAVAYTRRFTSISLTAEAVAATDGSRTARLTASFGFGPDAARGGGVRFSRERLAAQGQAMAEVFRDDNGDGLRQPDEAAVENVTLTVGTSPAPRATGPNGRAMIDALAPHRAVMVGIDESSLEDPRTRAALPGVVIVPRPGVITRVQLPLVSTGEVEGTLRRADGNGIEGADLELVDHTGSVRARARSDFDGFFLFESVPFGRYQIQLAAGAAAVLRVSARLGEVLLNRDQAIARLGDIQLTGTESLAEVNSETPSAAPAAGARR